MPKPARPVYYADYLALDRLLDAQKPLSGKKGRAAHDELLFIITHQSYELWFKQILHELSAVTAAFSASSVAEPQVAVAVSRLKRVSEIQKLLIDHLRVLETMTPLDFLDFRDVLTPASGFQSYQFRLIEMTLGLPEPQRRQMTSCPGSLRLAEGHEKLVHSAMKSPSLFELVQRWLERTPFLSFGGFDFWQAYEKSVRRMLDKDRATIAGNPTLSPQLRERELGEWSKTLTSFSAVLDPAQYEELRRKGEWRLSHKALRASLFILLYREQPILHIPFRLIDALVDIDENLAIWRHRHAVMAQRMIGSKIGTGGSSGQQYLRGTVESKRVFPDLFNLSTFLVPRSVLPSLPKTVERRLGFFHPA